MIEAKELRIGNYVRTGGSDYKMEMLDDGCSVCALEGLGLFGLDKCKPIPLTEEWHNKFGVEIDGHMSFVYDLPRKNNMHISIIFNGGYVYLRQGERASEYDLVAIWNTDLAKRDMFVNEFQNLYSALSGEELKIQE